jgi:hypothetical protein
MEKDKDTEENAIFCAAYFGGWDDALSITLKENVPYCPREVRIKEMIVVFYNYLAAHEEARKLRAAEALMLAFKDKWPCHQK